MPNLTPLELATLQLINGGLTYAQIDAGLGIYVKLQVNNRLDAIRRRCGPRPDRP
jgi:DNA-binding CsgD family transcriptional regulator